MVLKVEDASYPEDMPRLGEVIFGAHQGRTPFVNATHPNNLTKEGQEIGLKKLAGAAATADEQKWEKVVDTDTRDIVAASLWLVYTKKAPKLPTEPDLSGELSEDEEYRRILLAEGAKPEYDWWQTNELPLATLYILAVAPEHHRKGAGKLLMKSGLEFVDRIGAKCTVMSTEAAVPLYEQHGFKLQRAVTFKVPEKFASRPEVKLFWMTRERAKAD